MIWPKDAASDKYVLRPIAFASKSLSNTETHYNKIEREGVGILHGLQKFNHYYFTREIQIIIDHKPLAAIFKRGMAVLSKRLQCILLKTYQYKSNTYYTLLLRLSIVLIFLLSLTGYWCNLSFALFITCQFLCTCILLIYLESIHPFFHWFICIF